MATKRETLKFIRIKAGSSDERVIKGAKNFTTSYSTTFDDDTNVLYADYGFVSPKTFFQRGGFDLTDDDYKNLMFVIDGEFKPYNRLTHNLDALQPRVYKLDSRGMATNSVGTQSRWVDVTRESSSVFPPIIFRINPTSITIQKKKLFQKFRTRAGWAFQHWGPEIGEIKLQGTTGNLLPDPTTKFALKNVPLIGDIPILSVLNDERPSILNSPAYKALRELEKWYDQDQNEDAVRNGYLTVLEYRDRVYVGHLADFKLDEKGEQPFQLFYSITFVVHYDANDTVSATSRAKNQIVRNTQTLDVISRLKGNA